MIRSRKSFHHIAQQSALEVRVLSTLGLNYDDMKIIHLWNLLPTWEEYNGLTWADNWTPGEDIECPPPLFKAGSRWLDVRVCQRHHVIIAGARQAVIRIICYLGMLSPSSIAIQSSVSIDYCGRHCHHHEQHHPQQRADPGISCKNILPNNNTTSPHCSLQLTKNLEISSSMCCLVRALPNSLVFWSKNSLVFWNRVVHHQLLKLLLIRLQYTIYTLRQRTRVIRVNDHRTWDSLWFQTPQSSPT